MELKTKMVYEAIIISYGKRNRQFETYEEAKKFIENEKPRFRYDNNVKYEIKQFKIKVLEYWVVESGTCFDKSVSREYHNFETEQEAWKWYKENVSELSKEYGYCRNPEKREIIFE